MYQNGRYIVGVIYRIGKTGKTRIVSVADDKGMFLLGPKRRNRQRDGLPYNP